MHIALSLFTVYPKQLTLPRSCRSAGALQYRAHIVTQTQLSWVEETQLSINESFVAHVCSVSHSMCSSTAYYTELVYCPSVLQLTQTPTDNRLLTGWWLRKATRGGVVMATEACQTDCVEIGQVWTHNQYPPFSSTSIWHSRQRIYAVKDAHVMDSSIIYS